MNNQKFLTKRQAAAYLTNLGLPTSEKTLSKFVTVGHGPLFQKFGRRVVYTMENLNNWVESRLSSPRTNSSQEG